MHQTYTLPGSFMQRKQWRKEKVSFSTISWKKSMKWEDLPLKKWFNLSMIRNNKKQFSEKNTWQDLTFATILTEAFHPFWRWKLSWCLQALSKPFIRPNKHQIFTFVIQKFMSYCRSISRFRITSFTIVCCQLLKRNLVL